MWVGGQRHAPAAVLPAKARYPLYRRLGGPQGRSGRMRKISPLQGFHPRTVKSVASRYTDCVAFLNKGRALNHEAHIFIVYASLSILIPAIECGPASVE